MFIMISMFDFAIRNFLSNGFNGTFVVTAYRWNLVDKFVLCQCTQNQAFDVNEL